MSIIADLQTRRTNYNLNKELPVSIEQIEQAILQVTELTPDCFNCHSARLVVLEGDQHDQLWDRIYEVFAGKVSRKKIDTFKAGYGTILYFIDTDVVKGLQEKFPSYAANFPVWTSQANGMLQYAIWTQLCAMGLGVNIQHYNPVIDQMVKEFCQVPDSYQLIAQMPFGGAAQPPAPKAADDVQQRVKFIK